MRSAARDKQDIWFVERVKDESGIDTVYRFSKPILKRMSVSSTSGTPEELAAGIHPDYDRYITSYDRNFHPSEGTLVYVDTVPKMDDNGNLVVKDGTNEPVTEPDYVVKRFIGTQRGFVKRIGIKRRD